MEELRDIRNTNIFSAMGCCFQGSEKTVSKVAIFGSKNWGFYYQNELSSNKNGISFKACLLKNVYCIHYVKLFFFIFAIILLFISCPY